MLRKIIRTFRPKVAQLAYANPTSSGYLEPKAGQWVGTPAAFSDVAHYGLNIGWMIVIRLALPVRTGTSFSMFVLGSL